jgi:enoyl-CoA hydratase/carnithine racemase
MSTVLLETKGAVALLRMKNGVTNAIGPELVEDLGNALAQVKSDCYGCILTGGNKFFSIGLNLPQLLRFNRRQMDRFWDAFDQLALDLFTLPQPTAAAICGHAPAGGTILALAADCRFAAGGKKLMGLNEINIGVPVPFLADLILRRVVGDRTANRVVFGGELVSTEEAQRIGLVDEVSPEETVELRAFQAVTAMAERPRNAFAVIKQNFTESVSRRFERHRHAKKAMMLDCWFDPAVQRLLEKAAEKF